MRTQQLLLSSLLLFTTGQSVAQTKFEITPFAGYRMSEEFNQTNTSDISSVKIEDETSFGAVFAWPFDNSRQGELLVSSSNASFTQNGASAPTDINVTYIHLGGNVPLTSGSFPLLLSGGIGATVLSPDDAQYDSETKPSGNLGLSTKVVISENLNFVLGGRVYATLFSDDGRLLCNETDCSISVSGDLWLQGEVYTGISLTF